MGSGTHRFDGASEECPLPGARGLADAGVRGAAGRAHSLAASNRLPGRDPPQGGPASPTPPNLKGALHTALPASRGAGEGQREGRTRRGSASGRRALPGLGKARRAVRANPGVLPSRPPLTLRRRTPGVFSPVSAPLALAQG